MTAIAGLWRLDGRPDATEGCERMLAALRMYGPDASAAWDGGDVALGRCLKRTLPEDACDRQPLVGPSGLVLVADARVDNRDELARALGIDGERLASFSDAELMLRAYERWETDAFDRIYGDYACAVWDAARRRLILAKDGVGMRPLYYHRGERLFAFASMPKGLHALPETPYAAERGQDRRAADARPRLGPETLFEGVEKVEGGTFVVVRPDGASRGPPPLGAVAAHAAAAVGGRLRRGACASSSTRPSPAASGARATSPPTSAPATTARRSPPRRRACWPRTAAG